MGDESASDSAAISFCGGSRALELLVCLRREPKGVADFSALEISSISMSLWIRQMGIYLALNHSLVPSSQCIIDLKTLVSLGRFTLTGICCEAMRWSIACQPTWYDLNSRFLFDNSSKSTCIAHSGGKQVVFCFNINVHCYKQWKVAQQIASAINENKKRKKRIFTTWS